MLYCIRIENGNTFRTGINESEPLILLLKMESIFERNCMNCT